MGRASLRLRLVSRFHTLVYKASGGRLGSNLSGLPMLLLTTTGRKSGQRRTTPLTYLADGEALVLIASNAGNDWQPAWFWNISANPGVEVRIRGRTAAMTATVATADARARLWPAVVNLWPAYARYQAGTDREIPLVILEPGR